MDTYHTVIACSIDLDFEIVDIVVSHIAFSQVAEHLLISPVLTVIAVLYGYILVSDFLHCGRNLSFCRYIYNTVLCCITGQRTLLNKAYCLFILLISGIIRCIDVPSCGSAHQHSSESCCRK